MRAPRKVMTEADRGALVEMTEEGLPATLIAQALHCSTKTVNRWQVRLGLREKTCVSLFTEQEINRARTLVAEGMPLTWIAEDLHRNAKALQGRVRPDPNNVLEWKRVWQEIRRSETLRDLHDLFSPKPGRRAS